jgi:hypothetical protein
LFTASAFLGFAFYKNKFSFPSYMVDLKNTQTTVVTGNHEQCAVAVIHLNPEFRTKKLKEVLKACNNVQTIVNKLSPNSR